MRIEEPGDIRSAIESGEKAEISEDQPAKDLYAALKGLESTLSWGNNVGIENKKEELERYKEAWKRNSSYKPEFEFRSLDYSFRNCLELISSLNREAKKFDRAKLKEYGFKAMSVEDVRNLFRGSFQELELNVRLARNIENEKKWRSVSRKIWPLKESSARRSREVLGSREFEEDESRERLNADAVAEMFREEVERLGMDYRVLIRDVTGCRNVPEEQTLVVARGTDKDSERTYSKEEALMLTKHEVFHAVRSYNGMKASSNGFPPVLGIRTPFYDRIEEGGAVLREEEAGVLTGSKLKDYHLRNLAAHMIADGRDFMDAARELVNLGCNVSRAFGLLSRNREAIRHHIYIGGYYDWQELDREKMMVGKTNAEWTEKVWREVESDGVFEEPEITAGEVFSAE